VGSGRDGVLSVVAGVSVPAAGSAQGMQKAVLGVFLVMVGTCAVVISRGPRRNRRAR
jgi:uncharacterized membrane protein HdeD (DUF308 family)